MLLQQQLRVTLSDEGATLSMFQEGLASKVSFAWFNFIVVQSSKSQNMVKRETNKLPTTLPNSFHC
eukprot:176745-Amphidinium_carterae.1